MNYPEGISICITVYHSQKYIKETLDSVFAQTYFQNYDNWEVLLGLDGDIEDWNYIKTFINDYKYNSHIRVLLMDSNKGTYITSNTIMSEAIYNHMLRFDSDDIMPPDFIERVVSVMNTCDIVRVMCENFGNKSAPAHSCYGIICLSKEIFLKYGGYKAWTCVSDLELLKRLENKVNILQTNITFSRRIHNNNLTQDSNFGLHSAYRKNCFNYIKTKSEENPIVKTRVNLFKDMLTKTALCAIAKNENLYIREWVDYYKNLGIDKIFLYDNNALNGEHFEEVIDDYIQSNFVKIINVRGQEKGLVYSEDGINLQTQCYFDCYEKYGKDFNWICFFDIDEFLTFDENFDLQKFLSQKIFYEADTILIPWKIYDDNGEICYENKKVVERFTHVADVFKCYKNQKNRKIAVKSIVRTRKEIYNKTMPNHIHCFRLIGNRVVDSNGNLIETNDVSNFPMLTEEVAAKSICFLNHYRTKSLEEFLKRQLRRHWGTTKANTETQLTIDLCMKKYFDLNGCQKTLAKEKFRLMYEYIDFDLFNTINYRYYYNLYNKLDFDDFQQQRNDRYEKYTKNTLNFKNPITLNDKMNWLNLYDINPLKCFCADKILLHEYSKKMLGKDICIPILKVYDSPNDVNINELPDKFVLKCNHGYKMNIICNNKNDFNTEIAKEKLLAWINTDFGKNSLQYHYCGIKPKCFAEKYVSNEDGDLHDYKIWCQNGIPKFISVIKGRYTNNPHINIYDLNWNVVDLGFDIQLHQNVCEIDKKPSGLTEMINYAKRLSEPFKLVRIDFYEVNNKVYLGEMTFTPGNGLFMFKNENIAQVYARQLKIFDNENNSNNSNNNKIILELTGNGRLANSLYMISIGLYLKQKLNTNFYISLDSCTEKNYYINEIFPFEFFKNFNYISNVNYDDYKLTFNSGSSITCKEDLPLVNNQILTGWFIHKNFVDYNLVKNVFVPSKELKEEIFDLYNPTRHSLCIHVRRTDFLDEYYVNRGYNACSVNYYASAYNQLTLNCNRKYDKIFIVSDDIEWCKSNLNFCDNLIFTDKNTENSKIFFDLFLQSFVGDNIISASTYGWWGQYLNSFKNKLVVMPYPWNTKNPKIGEKFYTNYTIKI